MPKKYRKVLVEAGWDTQTMRRSDVELLRSEWEAFGRCDVDAAAFPRRALADGMTAELLDGHGPRRQGR